MCVSHKTVTGVTKSLGVKYDQRVQGRKLASNASPSQESAGNAPHKSTCAEAPPSSSTTEIADAEDTTRASYPHYIIIGDNIDKNVSPRDMTVDHQTNSLHYLRCARQNQYEWV